MKIDCWRVREVHMGVNISKVHNMDDLRNIEAMLEVLDDLDLQKKIEENRAADRGNN